MNNTSAAILKSVLLHLVSGGLLLTSMNFVSTPKPQVVEVSAPIINAVSIDKALVEAKLEKIQQEKDAVIRKEQQRRAEAARKKQQAEAKRKAEIKRRKEAAARKAKEKKLKEQRKKEEARKREIERQKKEEQQRQAEEKKKREREEKKRKEQEARKKREERERAEQERLLQEQLEAEQASRKNQQRRRQVLTELQKYEALIKQTIIRNLIVDDSMKGKKCRLNVKLASNGLVLSVRVLQGDTILCRAAESAVLKATTLPVSPDPDVYAELKDINLTVEPNL
ncbi:cell envelope integrity protein TolA [Alteromonas sp. a30]|uniref:cell envelope integrity protein TolA n=1 Tax=Alteromonas sp. a30 TaxID=2730917 RepID=UPI00228324D5|nr:cell envelope integrity protein TolA [Alteromonas sp. a30]MCY7295141.1 cell envelope integrity protein TolA [Alteromonas sp. a30]